MRRPPFAIAIALLSATTSLPILAQTAPAAMASAPAETQPEPQRIATAAGTSVILPPGWTQSVVNGGMRIHPPEGGDFLVAIVDVDNAADVDAAFAAAWATVPGFAREPLYTSERTAEEGFDQSFLRAYRTSPNERRSVFAVANKRGGTWTVRLADGADATIDIHGGALATIAESIRPAGFTPENLAGRPAQPFDADRMAQLRSFLTTAMTELGVPGVAYSIVTPDRVLFEGGIGLRSLGRPEPVDADTLFMVASNTKSLTTLVFAQLVDEGKVRWDQPITELYPAFRLADDEATAAAQVRHLICACTGLPRRDLDWIMTADLSTPASATFDQLSRVAPSSAFGAQFQYSNHLAAAAGFIAGHVVHPDMELGAAYDRMIQERVLNPLGMARSTFDFAIAQRGNHAAPHADTLTGEPALIPQGFNHSVFFMRPTGGLWSNARDMARLVQNELRLGVLPNGRRMVSAENLLLRRARGVPTSPTSWYGLGLETELIAGVEVVHHGGSMAGYKTDMVMLPEAGIGAVILTNADSGRAMLLPFMRRMVELIYGGEPRAAQSVALAARRYDTWREAEVARLDPAPRAEAVVRLAPRYRNADLGTIAVTGADAELRFDFGSFGSAMTTRRNDDGTVAFVSIDAGVEGFEFTVRTGSGAHDALVVRDAQHEYVYEPVP